MELTLFKHHPGSATGHGCDTIALIQDDNFPDPNCTEYRSTRKRSSKSWITRWRLLIFVIILLCAGCLSLEDDDSSTLGTIIGIDLGTTYSSVGVYNNGHVEIIRNNQGNKLTPSFVAFTDNETLIGESAKDQVHVNPERTIFNWKRLIGGNFDDQQVQVFKSQVPYTLVNKEGKLHIEVELSDGQTKVFLPEEISGLIIIKLKQIAEAFLGKKIKGAVITVPAYFNDAQRKAIADVGVSAGLDVVRLINEPSAAAVTYAYNNKGSTSRAKNILVYHLGGGTMHASVLKIEDGVHKVLATSADQYGGGLDFDRKVAERVSRYILREHETKISSNRALEKLRSECERAKRALSKHDQVPVEIEGLHLSKPLTRSNFEYSINYMLHISLCYVEKALQIAGLEKSEIDEIVLVGGSTKIPYVEELLKRYFKGKEVNKSLNPDEAVVYGATLQGAILSGDIKDTLLLDVAAPGVATGVCAWEMHPSISSVSFRHPNIRLQGHHNTTGTQVHLIVNNNIKYI